MRQQGNAVAEGPGARSGGSASRKAQLLLSCVLAAGCAPMALAATGASPKPVPDNAMVSRTAASFAERLADARRAYFADLAGDRGAADRARDQFSAIKAQWPHQPVVDAYLGSLDLLDSARTFAIWRKHTLAQDGLEKLDAAVNQAPDDLEARFVRALTTWHLPFFFHRKEQAEQDLTFIGPRAEQAAHQGRLPAPLAAAALDYWGQVLAESDARDKAAAAYQAAIRVDPSSPGAQDARKRLGQ